MKGLIVALVSVADYVRRDGLFSAGEEMGWAFGGGGGKGEGISSIVEYF